MKEEIAMGKKTVKEQIIRLDGQILDCQRFDGKTLADVLDQAISGIADGRIVTGVLLNGNRALRADLEAFDSKTWIVDIETESMDKLLKEVLSDLTLHLDSLMVVFQEIGNNLRRGNLPGVFASAEREAETGGAYMQGLEGIVAAQILVEEIGRIERQSGHDSFRVSFIEENDRIEAVLSSMLKSQESQDWILLADLVEYEILPILQRGRLKTSRALATLLESAKKDNVAVA